MSTQQKNKKLRASECVDCAAAFLRREWRMLLPFFLIFHLPLILLQNLILTRETLLSAFVDAAMYETFDAWLLFSILIGIFASSVYDRFARHIIAGACIYSAARRAQVGERPVFKQKLKAGLRLMLYRLLFMFIFGQVAGVVVYGFYILLFTSQVWMVGWLGDYLPLFFLAFLVLFVALPLLYLYLRFSYYSEFIVIRHENLFVALKHSWEATRGRARHIFCIYVITLLASAAVNAADIALLWTGVASSAFVPLLLSALLSVFTTLAVYLTDLSLTFSFIQTVPENEVLGFELELRSFLRTEGV